MPTPVAVTPMPKKVFPKFSSALPPPVDVVVSAPVPPAQPTPPTRRREPIKRHEASKEAAQPKKINRPKAPWNF